MTFWIAALILHYSSLYGINPVLALSVAKVESNYNPSAVGPTKDLGVFQLNPESFKRYRKSQLLDPETNVKLGIKYLVEMKKECVHQKNITWLVCYNYGVENAKHVKHPEKFPYVEKVRAEMDKLQQGDKVIVQGLYDLRVDGIGTYIGLSTESHFLGYYKIENEYRHVMNVHPSRVTKVEE